MNQEKVQRAIELQRRANSEIEIYGEVSEQTFREMMDIFDSLNSSEIDQVIKDYE